MMILRSSRGAKGRLKVYLEVLAEIMAEESLHQVYHTIPWPLSTPSLHP